MRASSRPSVTCSAPNRGSYSSATLTRKLAALNGDRAATARKDKRVAPSRAERASRRAEGRRGGRAKHGRSVRLGRLPIRSVSNGRSTLLAELLGTGPKYRLSK